MTFSWLALATVILSFLLIDEILYVLLLLMATDLEDTRSLRGVPPLKPIELSMRNRKTSTRCSRLVAPAPQSLVDTIMLLSLPVRAALVLRRAQHSFLLFVLNKPRVVISTISFGHKVLFCSIICSQLAWRSQHSASISSVQLLQY